MPFTVEFNDDGTITRVFQSGIATPLGAAVPRENVAPGKISDTLKNHKVRNVTSVTIVKANPTCIIQGGDLWCLP